MSDAFLTIDHVPEAELPAHASDGKTTQGDRVSMLEAGLLHVEGGRATFVRWGEVLGVLEHDGEAFVLVPRRPPRAPWIAVPPTLLGDDLGAVKTFAQRVRERGAGGGYREAVQQHRLDLSKFELTEKVRRREAVPGALEVPSTIYLGKLGHSAEGFVLFGIIAAGWLAGFFAVLVGAFIAAEAGVRGAEGLVQIAGLTPYIGVVFAAWFAVRLRKRWRAARKAELPRQRVLVLAPDGCIIGFRTGVQTLDWAEVGGFEVGPTEPEYNEGLIVRGVDGEKLGDIDAGWLEQPLRLVVDVAETYRKAAAG